jgi:hypothetical protein
MYAETEKMTPAAEEITSRPTNVCRDRENDARYRGNPAETENLTPGTEEIMPRPRK